MKRLFTISLVLCGLWLAGCNSGPAYDKTAIEQKVKDTYTAQLKSKGLPGECTAVSLVQDGSDQWKLTGFAKFADGTQKDVTVTIDPNTKEMVF